MTVSFVVHGVAAPAAMMDANDLHRAMELVVATGGRNERVAALRIDGEPIAKARARVNRHRHYTPQRTADAELDIAGAVIRGRIPRFDGNVAVAAIFYRSNRHRIDTDNLFKTVLDGITKSGQVWDDDSQVTAIVAITEYDPDDPRTVIAIAPHVSTLKRGENALTHECETCGKRYRPHGGSEDRTRYCSRACRPRSIRVCADCGGRTSHQSAKRCRVCYGKFRRKESDSLPGEREGAAAVQLPIAPKEEAA